MKEYRIKKICATPAERERGMQNDTLEPDECCVFQYGVKMNYPVFWGKDTPQNLYICLISDGVCVFSSKIKKMDMSPVILNGSGDMVVESIRKIYEGQNVTINGKKLVVE